MNSRQKTSHASSTGTTSDSKGGKQAKTRVEARKRAKREERDNLCELFLKYDPSPNIHKQRCKAQPYTLPAPRKKLESQNKIEIKRNCRVKSMHSRIKTQWEKAYCRQKGNAEETKN
jgi:hypothetical protein